MAISDAYLAKIRVGIRIQSDADFDAELKDIIQECRQDLIAVGVTETAANDETDFMIMGAVRSFARWNFPINERTAQQNRLDYMSKRDELRRSEGYMNG